MKIQYAFSQILLLSTLCLLLSGCSKEDEDPVEFNLAINQLSFFDQPEEMQDPEVLSSTSPMQDPDNPLYDCYTTTYRAAPGFDEMLSLDPTTDVIFPGAMLDGASIPTGEYIPITVDRQPITLSVSLQNLSGSPVITVDDPKLSTVREGIKTLMEQEVVSSTPAKVNFEISQVYSREHLNVALGANYRSAGNEVSSSFDFTSTTTKNKFVLKYLQVYYTIDMDPPQEPGDLFDGLPDVNQLGAVMPVYVASMAYGRMVLYTIETSSTATEINAAFSAAFSSGGGNISSTHKKTINESSIKAFVLGGNGASAAQTIGGPSDVYDFIAEGGEYSKDSPGAPLSYKLRYIKQGVPVARVVLSTKYEVRECSIAYPTYKLEVDYILCKDCPEVGDPDIFGRLTVQAYVNNNKSGSNAEWKKGSGDAVEVKKNIKYTLSKTKNVTLSRPNFNTDYIKIDGWLKDRDWPSDDDDFGSDDEEVTLSELPVGAKKIITLDFDGRIEAGFAITRVE